MNVFVYRETNDNNAFGEELIKIFSERDLAERFLKSRVELFFREPWERCVEIVREEGGVIWPAYVEYPDGDGYNFFTVESQIVCQDCWHEEKK